MNRTLQGSADGDRGIAGLVEGAGAVLAFIGAYVPWVVTTALITVVPVRGVDTQYGRVLPLVPLAALGLLAWRWYARRGRGVHLVILLLGIFTLALPVIYVMDVQNRVARTQTLMRSGPLSMPGSIGVRYDVGIYLTAAGGLAMLAGGLLGLHGERSPQTRD